MHIHELIGEKADIIEKAMKNPGLAPKRKPTIEQAMKAVASEVEFAAMQNVQQKILPVIQDMYDMYVLMNGEYEDVGMPENGSEEPDEDFVNASRTEYSSSLDDELEKALEPLEQYLSADWLGRNTIDTRLWEENAIVKLSQSVAKEVFKQLSYQKTPAQVLSNAGIVQADVEIFFEQHLAQAETPKGKQAMSDATATSAEDLAAKIKSHVGNDFDQMAVYEDLELACDDDEILANGAGKRLGLDEDDVQALQMVVLEYGEDTADHMIELIGNASSGEKAAKPKAERKPAAPKKDAAPVEGAVDPKVLVLMKNHGSTKDTEMSATLGVSRATYNNWLNGKNAFSPDGDQYSAVRDELVRNINGLLEALATLDGTEQMEVQ